jgi:hypothetical protein
VKHEHGKGNIVNRLRKLAAGTGMLDEDREGFQAPGLRDYRPAEKFGKLVLMKHATTAAKRLILICPRLEEWLYERAADCGVKPGDYGLPDSAELLKAIPRYEQKPKFPNFLERLRQVDPEVQHLGKWIAP